MNQAKEFIEYILNAVKIWILVQPWESAIRTRNGKNPKKLGPGLHFRLPYLDSIYIQENRTRVIVLPMQTVTTNDIQTISFGSAIGYSIDNLEQLYDTIYQPETVIMNMAMSKAASIIFDLSSKDVKPLEIEKQVLEYLNEKDYGIKFEYFSITNFAIVRTFRLLQEPTYQYEGLKMDNKK